jgi:hypothetical protein
MLCKKFSFLPETTKVLKITSIMLRVLLIFLLLNSINNAYIYSFAKCVAHVERGFKLARNRSRCPAPHRLSMQMRRFVNEGAH